MAAQEIAPEDRTQFVADACGTDQALLNEVNSLLEAGGESEAFFQRMSGRIGLPALADDAEVLPDNKVIGQWRLVRVIGRGGMGAVYLAERADGQFDQQAALKILPFGLDTQAARQRFLTERQILAHLSHDGIARLLDGGVTGEGMPYFVMEYVDGQPIDDYCDDNQLDVRGRIRLFLGVLAAVSHAHAHLVVHRDIKPSNVLITRDGAAKLLDFGIAKLLSAEAGAGDTREIGVALTPEFAAPEQFVGGTVTTTTDVYTLGLLLYALLSGRNPRGGINPDSMVALQAIATEDPPRLSDFVTDDSNAGADKIVAIARQRKTTLAGLQRNLRGDLDNILRKALQFDAADRYPSVAEFTADLRRFLDDEPVKAQPVTVVYRVNKFVRRHRGGVLVASLMLVALLASTAITAWQMLEAQRQRDLAVLQQQRVQASSEFYGLLMEEMGPDPFTTVELLDRGRELLDKQFGVEQAFMGPLLIEVSRRYGGLRERAKQEELLHQAELVAREHKDDDVLARVLCKLQDIYAIKDPGRAADYAAEGDRVYAGISRPGIEASMECLRMKSRLAQKAGDVDGALNALFAAMEILDASPLSTTNLRGPLLGHIAYTYYNAGLMDDSIFYLDETLKLLDATGRGNSLGYIRVASNKAVTLQSLGRLNEGLVVFEDVIGRMRDSGYEQRGLASLLGQYGTALVRVGRVEEAEEIFREGLAAGRAGGDEESVAAIQMNLSNVYGARNEFERALESLDAAEEFYSRDETADRVAARRIKALRVKALRKMGRIDDALVVVDALLSETGYPEAERAPGLLSALIHGAETHRAAGNLAYAEELATDLLGRLQRQDSGRPTPGVDVGRTYIQRAEIRIDSGNVAGAREDVESAIPIIAAGLGEDHDETQEARALLETL